MHRFLPVFVLLLLLLPARAGEERLEYPETRTVDVVDDYHGTKVADPYRWLEDDNADETKAWVKAQNAVTRGFLDDGRTRKRIRRRLEELWNYPRLRTPQNHGGRIFFQKNDGLQNQYVHYVADGPDAEPRVLIDPNTLSEDGTVSIRATYVNRAGTFMVYSLSRGGSDWQEFRVRDVGTATDLPEDHLQWVKFSGAAWTADGSGFFYARMPAPAEGKALTAVNRNHKIYFHRLGTPQSDDVLVYERPSDPDWGFYPVTTDDGRFLIVYAWKRGSSYNAIFLKDLQAPEKGIVELIPEFDANYSVVGNDGGTLWVQTDLDAPKGRIVAIDVAQPGREHWKTLVPEGKWPIEEVSVVGDRFVIQRLVNARSSIRLHTLDGAESARIELPTLGSAGGFAGKRTDRETFYYFTSFTFPTTIYRYDFDAGKSEVYWRPEVDFDPDDFETKQVVYPSKDLTDVTMFLVHKKGLKLDGNNPTRLYGYGGFNLPQTPYFSPVNVVWFERGGVYAMANLRGGSEKGEAWHQAGMREKKQNVFDDFIAAAEALAYNKYTRPKKLAIEGGSNGGLLVGACMTQRPDLFGACLPSVGVMDMLRFHKFTIGYAWVAEYGSPDDPEMFPVLHKYSPYHNLRKGVKYPATMVLTGDHDDRVVPAHSFKFAARLQACQAGPAPVLIRIETSAGHGAGTPTSKRIDAAADRLTFLAKVLEE